MTQYGFYFDEGRCFNCQACTVACKDWNGVNPGPSKWLRMFRWEEGTFPNVRLHYFFAPCYHCENPPCVAVANGAMIKEPKYGAVLIDPSRSNDPVLRAAWNACPYGSIVFDSDSVNANASKCTMCIDRLEQGLMPECAMACPMRAIDFGRIDDLKKKYPNATSTLKGMPANGGENPAMIFKPSDAIPKKQIVPYDQNTGMQLLGSRFGGLSPIYSSPSDVTSVPPSVVSRNKLVLKPTTSDELMYYTADDEG
jgi:anaerobic dimethyl sulfoxide reductase subunit B (iron-sulfur subunit)